MNSPIVHAWEVALRATRLTPLHKNTHPNPDNTP